MSERKNSHVRRLVTGRGRSGLQDNLRFIAGPHHLKEIAQRRVILRIPHQDVDRYPSSKMEGIRSFLSFQAVSDDVPVLILRRWPALGLPVWGQLDGLIVLFLTLEFKID